MLAACLILNATQARAVSLLRDPDIEHALRQLAEPILAAAGLGGSVRILVVNDRTLNAFVTDPQHIFIHYGLILKTENAAMLQAVIAHEAAHIANGHIARRLANIGTARTAANLGTALAVLAGAAAGNAQLATGVAIGTQGTAQRLFLAHTRAEEASADQSGVRYMVRAGANPQGAVQIHELFRGQELLNVSRQDPYSRSHPLSRDRMRAMQAFVSANKRTYTPDPQAEYWFARARGKVEAFTGSPKQTQRKAKDSPTKDIRLMREAIALHRLSNQKAAVSKINQAIAMRPNDPFLYELKGQILLEGRNFGAAVAAYKRSVDLAPSNALCLGGYGRALLAAGRPKQALKALEKARARDFRDARLMRDLGSAYAQLGQTGKAALSTAERYALQGRLKDAAIHAKRAKGLLPRGSQGWQRASDIEYAAKQAAKRK